MCACPIVFWVFSVLDKVLSLVYREHVTGHRSQEQSGCLSDMLPPGTFGSLLRGTSLDDSLETLNPFVVQGPSFLAHQRPGWIISNKLYLLAFLTFISCAMCLCPINPTTRCPPSGFALHPTHALPTLHQSSGCASDSRLLLSSDPQAGVFRMLFQGLTFD